MNRQLVPLALFAALIALPTAAHAMPLPTPDPAPAGMTITAAVDCNTFDIAIAGLTAGQRVMVEMGSEPTYGFDFQADHPMTFQFAVVDNTATASLPVGFSEQGTEFMTAIGVIDIATGAAVWPFYQWVDCTQPVQHRPVVVQIADPIVAEMPATVVEGPVVDGKFADVALAPPW